jgi:hypothetical protein
MESQGLKSKELLTILGPVPYSRSMFQCPVCQATRYPGDEELDIVETTPDLTQLANPLTPPAHFIFIHFPIS